MHLDNLVKAIVARNPQKTDSIEAQLLEWNSWMHLIVCTQFYKLQFAINSEFASCVCHLGNFKLHSKLWILFLKIENSKCVHCCITNWMSFLWLPYSAYSRLFIYFAATSLDEIMIFLFKILFNLDLHNNILRLELCNHGANC